MLSCVWPACRVCGVFLTHDQPRVQVSLADMAATRDIVHDLLVTFHPFHQELARELSQWQPGFAHEFLVVEVGFRVSCCRMSC